jgi:hypothetical protein
MPDNTRPMRFSKLLRFAPSAVGLVAFVAMACFYKWNYAFYLAILKGVGIAPWSFPFLDSEFMYSMKKCWLQGVDVYQGVPCDVIPDAKMAYSPLWQRLPLLPSDQAARVPIGVVTDVLALISISFLPPARSWRDAILLSLATVSTMVCFALERNNIDVWIYLLVFCGGLLFSGRFLWRCVSYLLFLLAGLLKYYPMILFLMALRERPRRFWAIAFSSLAGLILFVLLFRQELRESMPNVPSGSPFGDMVGVVNLPLMVAQLPWPTPEASAIARVLCAVCLAGGVLISAYRLAARPVFAASLARLPEAESVWLVIGCLVMGGCYFLIQSVGYRGVWLLPVLSGLLALRRASDDSALRQELGRVTIIVVAIMWMEGIRLWATALALGLTGSEAPGVELAACLVREVLWLYLARVMAAVAMSHVAQSNLGRSLQKHSSFFREFAPLQP